MAEKTEISPAEVDPEIEAAQESEPGKGGTLVAARYSYMVGPLPPPRTLAQYEEICPGAAERILGMAENQAHHRQELEKMVISSNARSQERGPLLGFILALMVIVIGAVCIWQGKDVAGLTALIGALAAIVVPFIYGKRKQEVELAHKRRDRVEDHQGES